MDTIYIILIVGAILISIIIIIVIIIVVMNNNNNGTTDTTGTNNQCTTNADCPLNMICTNNTCVVNINNNNSMVINNRNNANVNTSDGERTMTKIIKRKHFVYSSSDSESDNEENSDDDFSDPPFDISSDFSHDNSSHNYNSKSMNSKYRTLSKYGDHAIIDGCTHSDHKWWLLANNTIVDEHHHRSRIIEQNIKCKRITSFRGYMYALAHDGSLYTIPNNAITENYWHWNNCNLMNKNIVHISTTYDGNNLWIQTKTKGFLYDREMKICMNMLYENGKRVYGQTREHYIDIRNNSARVNPSGKIYSDVLDAMLTCYNDILTIDTMDGKHYRGMVFVDWIVYYLEF